MGDDEQALPPQSRSSCSQTRVQSVGSGGEKIFRQAWLIRSPI
jgi:hypothetical protein